MSIVVNSIVIGTKNPTKQRTMIEAVMKIQRMQVKESLFRSESRSINECQTRGRNNPMRRHLGILKCSLKILTSDGKQSRK